MIGEVMKTCSKCGLSYDGRRCKPCFSVYMKIWNAANAENVKVSRAKKYQRNKAVPGWLNRHHALVKQSKEAYRSRAIEAYGGKCVCCGIDDPRFLTFDHVNGDGAKHRRERGKVTVGYYKDILAWIGDGGIQLLCWNCNCAKQFRGQDGLCPHETDRKSQEIQ